MTTDNSNNQSVTNKRSLVRRLGIAAAGFGLGSAAAYLLSRLFRRQPTEAPGNIVDDRGTGQEKAAQILRNLRDLAFESSDEKLALALGRPVEEIAGWDRGAELIDDDVVMKARGIAMHRGVTVE